MPSARRYYFYIILAYSLSLVLLTWFGSLQPESNESAANLPRYENTVKVPTSPKVQTKNISFKEYPTRMTKWFKVPDRVFSLRRGGDQLPTPEELYYRRRDKKVNPFQYGYLINEESVCDPQTEMLIIVHSYHPHADRRDAIRHSWGGYAKNEPWPNSTVVANVKLVFALGKHHSETFNHNVLVESKDNHDIIQGDFMDDYKNMTIKSLFGLRYFSKFCHSAKYLLKSDDDMFINIPYLLTILRQTPMKRSIMGPLLEHSKAYRGGKWKVTVQQFPFSYYPPYEAGAAYIISADITRELFETAEYMPAISIDDVYITGILGKILNVTHMHQPGFAYWTSKAPSACDIMTNRIITGTKMTPILLQHTWSDMKKLKPCQVKVFCC